MRFADAVAAVLVSCFVVACHSGERAQLRIPSEIEWDSDPRLTIVLYVDPLSCLPRMSTAAARIAELLNDRPSDARVTVVASRPFPPGALDAWPPRFRDRALVRYVDDRAGKVRQASGVSVSPYLLVFDARDRILLAKALSAPSAGQHELRRELDSLYAIR